MKTRVISGAVLTVITLAVVLLGGPVLVAALLFCSEVGMYEYYKACGIVQEGKKYPAPAIAAFVGAACYYVLLLTGLGTHYGVLACLVMTAVLMVYVLIFPNYTSVQAAETVFGFFYVAVMLSFIFLTRAEENGELNVWPIFLSSWVADTCAYFVGRKFGKHKMTPVLSPHKTIEGALGGVLGSGISGILFTVIFNNHQNIWQYFVICALGAVISIFGDLTASAIKRDKNIKDYGNLIPGHGGILDRFDSVIFTAPGIYFLTQLLIR